MDGGLSQNSFPPHPSSIDKSTVLDVKPLRYLKPIFPSSPQAPPFDCPSPYGPFPPGFSPFYPFRASQGPENSADQNRETTQSGVRDQDGGPFRQPTDTSPFPMPAPVRSYRSPNSVEVEVPNGNAGSSTRTTRQLRRQTANVGNKRAASPLGDSSSQPKKGKRNQNAVFTSSEFGSFPQADGSRESVEYVLMAFDGLRRRLSQLEDARESPIGLIKRADLKSGNILMSKGLRTNMRKRFGSVPGVEIGDIFFFRFELCLVGAHSQSMAGIDYTIDKSERGEEPLAVSIVSSGGYDDDVEETDILIYTGQGGNISKKDKLVVTDQKLERGNLALERSLHRGNEIRVIRGMKDTVNPTSKVYVFDGLFIIQESWIEKGKSGQNTFKYKLVRKPGERGAFPLWKSIQKWKEGVSSRPGLILPDLTSGAESIPVSLVNAVDNEKGPAYFTYISTLKYSTSFNIVQPSFGCNCHKACRPGDLNCSCLRKNGGDFPYIANNILVSRKPMVHECGPTCPCVPDCKNRVSQTGLKVHLEVFKTTNRGWGLRSWDPIRAGTFICEYAGEVIDMLKLKQYGEQNEFIFRTDNIYDDSFKWNHDSRLLDEEKSTDVDDDYSTPSPLVINAKNVGNVARFVNHSCSPNVFWQPVIYEHNSESFVHVGFFAIKHIPPMTELTYDYGVTRSENNGPQRNNSQGKKKCLCGTLKCRGYFG